SYLDILNSAGILLNLSMRKKKLQKILTNEIPSFPNHKENILIQMHFEGYTHEAINKVEKDFLQKIRQSQGDFKGKMLKQDKVPQQKSTLHSTNNIADYISIIESFSL